MKKILMIAVVLNAYLHAWDGQRQGFLFGIGMGVTSATLVTLEKTQKGDVLGGQEYLPGFTSKIGYAWNNSNAVLLYTQNMNAAISYTGINYQRWSQAELPVGFWYFGLGLITNRDVLIYDGKKSKQKSGAGLNINYGIEFVKHMSIDMGFTTGVVQSINSDEKDFLMAFVVSINLLGY
jgi:hypothetical protein